MEHQVIKPFVDKESEAYFAADSFFTSKNYERVIDLENKGFIKANQEVSTLKKVTTRKKASE